MTKQIFLLSGILLIRIFAPAQSLQTRIHNEFSRFLAEPQLRHAQAAFYVLDLGSGALVYARHEETGLAPASAQKVITAATALDILGKSFRYKTVFGYTGTIVRGTLEDQVIVKGSGDPSLGSPRFSSTLPTSLGAALRKALHAEGISSVAGGMLAILPNQETQHIPNGWIWEDIGNYYGAGHASLNWKENQFDLLLNPGTVAGEAVKIAGGRGEVVGGREEGARWAWKGGGEIRNELRTGPKGSGDNAYLYYNPGTTGYSLRGTVPCCVDSFRISGAVSDPVLYALSDLSAISGIKGPLKLKHVREKPDAFGFKPLYVHISPGLDSLVYWFLQKSINLYGEALVHTIAQQQDGYAAYERGIDIIRKHWKERGIDTAALNIVDGSGLSPQNRVTAKALTDILVYAAKRPWYDAFYAALPVYNGIKMKSGTIGGAKSFTGYIKSKDGKIYAFAIIVNNFTGPSGKVVQGMYKVLDELK